MNINGPQIKLSDKHCREATITMLKNREKMLVMNLKEINLSK